MGKAEWEATYRAKDPEKYREMMRKAQARYRAKNPEAVREKSARYYTKHRDLIRARATAKDANARAKRFGAPGVLTAEDVLAVRGRQVCHWCGATESEPWWTIDHVVPTQAGGANDVTNIVCACHWCNTSKRLADRPGRWAQDYEACVQCGTTERQHNANGLCTACYSRAWKEGAA